MKYRWILWALTLVLALTVASGAAVAEHFDAAPTIDVTLGRGESFTLDTTGLLVAEGQTLKFKTSDGKVAAVSADGVAVHQTVALEVVHLSGGSEQLRQYLAGLVAADAHDGDAA